VNFSIVGIDHGLKGGLCVLNQDGSVNDLLPLPEPHLLSTYLAHLQSKRSIRVYLEELSINPAFSRTVITTMARNLGKIEGVLVSLNLPVCLVSPRKWQALMFSDERVQAATGHPKARSFVAAKILHPGIDLVPAGKRSEHDGLADAYLIARYGHALETSEELS
jgi:hypothetical protein